MENSELPDFLLVIKLKLMISWSQTRQRKGLLPEPWVEANFLPTLEEVMKRDHYMYG